MRNIKNIFMWCVLLGSMFLTSTVTLASHMVRGYAHRSGTYIMPHRSMNPYESKRTGLSYHNNLLTQRHPKLLG